MLSTSTDVISLPHASTSAFSVFLHMSTRFTVMPGFAPRSQDSRPWLLFLGIAFCLSILLATECLAKTKPPRAPRPEPELKILDLNIAPMPYAPRNGPLEFAVTVQLPRELDSAAILEVAALISSPSKTSLRFLTHRQPARAAATTPSGTERPKLVVQLSWDGQDHRKQLTSPGTYAYEVRIKLLANGEKGLRTMMVAWPKRGTLEVK